MVEFETRVAAYGVIVKGDEILLAHFNAMGATNWTLPGGGLELGEDCESAAIREIFEETGYRVALEGLLGVDSVQIPTNARLDGRPRHLHSLRLVYEARVIGGSLNREIGGSTDDAKWFRLRNVHELERADLVDTAISLWQKANGAVRPT